MADRSLLLVDDDALLLDSLVRILRVRFLVRTATSPIRALEMLRASPREFFAIVTDVRMPEMDGPTFLERASRIAPHARTILMSGDLETDDLMRAVNGPGVFRALMKPLAPPRLIGALEDAWQAYLLSTSAASGRKAV
ncbi:MAG: response regulator [Polyangiaceae bacterium]